MATPATGSTAAGTITVVVGNVRIVGVDGVARVAMAGEKVFVSEVIETGANGIIQVQLAGGRFLDLGRDSKLALTSEILAEAGGGVAAVPAAVSPADAAAAAKAQAAAEAAKIAAGADPTQVTEATAAGGAPAAGGGADGGGGTPVIIDQANSSGEVTSGFPTRPAGIAFPEIEPALLPLAPVVVAVVIAAIESGISLPPEAPAGAVVQGDTLWLKEDGSGGLVSITATSSEGSSLSTLVITGFNVTEGWSASNYNFSGLDPDGVGGITVSFDAETGTLTITGLSGTSYSGTFAVTPPEDSDIDVGTLVATVTAVSDFDPTLTAEASDSITVSTDAVLDDYGNVSAEAQNAVESNEGSQTISLGTSLSIDGAGFTWSASGGADPGTETLTVTLTLDAALPEDAVLSSTAGTVTQLDATHYTLSGSDIEAAVNELQVTVAEGWEGTISGAISTHAVDTTSGDGEFDTSDNARDDSATFSVTVGTGEIDPSAGVQVLSEGGLVKEDGSVQVQVTASSGDVTDELTSVTVTLPAGWAADGQTGNVFTLTASGQTFDQVLTIHPAPEDTDIDGQISVVAHARDISTPSVTADSAPASASVVVDAVLDDAVSVTGNAVTGTENVAVQVVSLGLTASQISPYGQSDAAPADATESGMATVTVTVPEDFTLGTLSGSTFTALSGNTFSGTPAQVEAWLESLAVQVAAGAEGSFTGSVSVTYSDAPTLGSGEPDTSDNTSTSTAEFSVRIEGAVGDPIVATNLEGNHLVIKEDGSGSFTVTVDAADTTDKITQIVVIDLPAGATITGDEGGSFSGGVYTVNGTQQHVVLTVTVAGPADSDMDLGDITFTATAVDISSPTLTAEGSVTATVDVDAVVDQPAIDISVADGEDANATFQIGESGAVNVSATFGDVSDDSEIHTVTVSIPTGFVASVEDGTYTPGAGGTGGTVSYTVSGASLDTSFLLTNQSAADGTVTLTGTATANENPATDNENDLTDNLATATDTADATVARVPPPEIILADAGGDTVWVKEDATSGAINVSASSSPGSSLDTIVITGFKVTDGWSAGNYDFSGLDPDGAGGVTVSFNAGTVTISGLSGTSYVGSFTVQPPVDADADLGLLTGTVTAKNDVDPTVTAQASDTVTVNTDAVLDEGVDVAQAEAPEVDESAEAQIVSLGLNATSVAPFVGSGAGGDDTDTSESVTATVTLSEGVLMSDGEGTDATFMGTADEVVAWLESLQVEVPAGFEGDGEITGTVSVTAADTETDNELTTADNAYDSNNGQVLNFTVHIDSLPVANDDSAVLFTGQSVTINLAANDQVGDDAPGAWTMGGTDGTNYFFSATGDNEEPGVYNDSYVLSDSDGDDDPANITVTVLGGPTVTLGAQSGGDIVWVKEDGVAQSVGISATAADGSHLTQIVVTGLVSGFTYDFTGLAGTVNFNAGTGTLTISGLSGTSYNDTFTVAPGTADSDADLGTLTATATVAADANASVTTTAQDIVIVRTDAVLDQFGDVAAATLSDVNQSTSAQDVNLGLSMSLANAGFTESLGAAGADTDGSESISVTVTVSAGTLSLASGAPAGSALTFDSGAGEYTLTSNNSTDLAAAVSKIQVTVPANFDGTITGTISTLAVDTQTDNELTETDNTKPDSVGFTLTVVDGIPTQPVDDTITVEEESVPAVGGGVIGNDEPADGYSYRVLNGNFNDNANWGPDGFGGIVNVTASSGSPTRVENATTITLSTTQWELVVTKATGAYTFTMLDNILAPTGDNGENTTALPTFNVTAKDGDGDEIGFNLNANVVDDVPEARNDYDDVVVVNGVGSTPGNVLNNDGQGADTAKVTQVNATPVAASGNTQIQGEFGLLTISSDGTYTYAYNHAKQEFAVSPADPGGTILTAFGDGVSPFSGNNLDPSALPNATVSETGGLPAGKRGWGVDDSAGPATVDAGEHLVIQLAKAASGDFTFKIGQFNVGQGDPATLLWSVYGQDGHLISSGNLVGGQTQSGIYVGNPITFTEEVKYVVFEYSGSGQGYVVTDITYQAFPTGIDDFTYKITDADGDTNTAHLYITSDEFKPGTGGTDTHLTTDGEDILMGGAGDDVLNAGSGDDILIGGSGSDNLTGGTGKDIFAWQLGDGNATTAPVDTVIGFNQDPGDKLDLSDLLIGEQSNAGSLLAYLHFESDGAGGTIMHVSSQGGNLNGANGALVDQKIVLAGVGDLTQGGSVSDSDIITQLMTKLVTD